MSLTAQNFEDLDTKGFTVVRNVVPKELCRKARGLVDAIIGSPPPAPPALGLKKCPNGDEPGSRGQGGSWPVPGDERPVISTGNYTHSIHHPIPDANYGYEGVMAGLVEPYIKINQQLLRCTDEEAKDLKLMQQFFRRTDLGPEPRHGSTTAGERPRGWHMDQAFLPRHYDSRPREMFYHTILALHDVGKDCAPFFGARNSFRKAMELSRSIPPEQWDELVPAADMTRTFLGGYLHRMAEERGEKILDPLDYEEVHWNEGDLVILDPMCTHSGSSNGGGVPARYALFTAMFHPAAVGTTLAGLKGRTAVSPAYKFPQCMRDATKPELRSIYEWELPEELPKESTPKL